MAGSYEGKSFFPGHGRTGFEDREPFLSSRRPILGPPATRGCRGERRKTGNFQGAGRRLRSGKPRDLGNLGNRAVRRIITRKIPESNVLGQSYATGNPAANYLLIPNHAFQSFRFLRPIYRQPNPRGFSRFPNLRRIPSVKLRNKRNRGRWGED